MNAQRSLAFLLVALQAAALAYCFRTTIFSVAIIVVALIGWLSNIRLASPYAARRWPIVLAVLYIVQRTAMPPSWYSGTQSFWFAEACLTAEYFLVFQVGQFFVRRDGDRLPSYLPVLAIVALTFTGDFQARGNARVVFQAFSVTLVAVSAAYFAACRLRSGDRPSRPLASHRMLLATVLLASGGIGWIAASNLHRHSRKIEMALVAVMSPGTQADSAGFSGRGKLGSVARQKAGSGDRVAIRVWSDSSPGYLRGRAFDTYQQAEWHTDRQRIVLRPDGDKNSLPNESNLQGDVRTYSLFRSGTDPWKRLEIWPSQSFHEVVFVPSNLAVLQTSIDGLSMDMHGIIEAKDAPSTTAYVARTSETAKGLPPATDARDDLVQQIPDVDWRRLTALPEDLDPRIRELADRVAGESATSAQKIAAVERYFLDNYQYDFGITIPTGTDPLTYFLLERPPAHCEYFASGTAVLLRAVGVPCRYVTGFVVAERNDYGDYWVARNRDAHAWVEAYDNERGWIVVEATPASGVPHEAPASAANQFWDNIRAQWQRLVASIRQGGAKAVFGLLGRWLMHPMAIMALAILATGFALRWIWHHRRRKPARPRDPCLERLQKLLNRMDGRWRKAGLLRQPHETLHQFASRIASASSESTHRQAAEWYREFAAIRYGGRADPATVQALQQTFAAAVERQS